MPTWNDLREELGRRRAEVGPQIFDVIRRERLKRLADYTGRPVIVYAVDFLHQTDKARAAGRDIQIDWPDKEGFVEVTRGLPNGPLDLILHSPGGNPLAAESIVKLIRSKFNDVRVFVPNVAKSAATMVALSADVIAMDERGELGPIDPQMIVVSDQQTIISPARAILDQFKRAQSEIQNDAGKLPGWLPIIRQYGPSLLVEAENAIELSKRLVTQWLVAYMLKNDDDAQQRADTITSFFAEHNNFLSHGRMVGIDDVAPLGVNILDLRTDELQELQELVWEVYTTIGLTFQGTGAYKIIENNLEHAFIKIIQQVQIIGNVPRPQSPVAPYPNVPPGELAQPVAPSRQQRRHLERQAKKAKR